MNIITYLFGDCVLGEWVKESQRPVVATYSSIFCKEYTKDLILTIEVHSKTGNKRAYLKDIQGRKTPVDMDYLEGIK